MITEEKLAEARSMAEKLGEALKELLMHHCPVPDKDGNPVPYEANPELAQEALSLFEQGKKGRKG